MNARGFPIRPLKFLLAVDIILSASAGTPLCVPTQGPHPGATITAPAFTKISINPNFNAWSNTARGTLFNKEGLPASSFRTDNWEK